jgi:hypothetical protein
VANVKWNKDGQMDALWNGLSNELKDSIQDANIPDNIIDIIKMYWNWVSQNRARAAKRSQGNG